MRSLPARPRTVLLSLVAALACSLGVVVAAVAGGVATGAERLPDLRQEPPSQVAVRRSAEGRPVLVFRSAVGNVGQGPLVLDGRRARGDRLMRVTQQLRRVDGSVARVPVASRMRYLEGGHNHWHLQHFDRFDLRNPATGARVALSQKVGFCLGGRYQVEPPIPGTPAMPAINTNCGRYLPGLTSMRMGIDVGYADDYAAFVEFQYIDLSRVRPGRYLLAHEADPDHRLVVGDRSDDISYALIDLGAAARRGGLPRVTVLAASVGTPPATPVT